MKDAAISAPLDDTRNSSRWHRFWAKVFGRQMPTSGDRVHIGNLVVAYRPGQSADGFGERWGTDARKVYVIGDLWVFDYGDTPATIHTPRRQPEPLNLGDHADLLAENTRTNPVKKPKPKPRPSKPRPY